MTLTVKQLKKALRGVPDDAEIVLCDHDHSENEYNGGVSSYGHETVGGERYDVYRRDRGGEADIFYLHV